MLKKSKKQQNNIQCKLGFEKGDPGPLPKSATMGVQHPHIYSSSWHMLASVLRVQGCFQIAKYLLLMMRKALSEVYLCNVIFQVKKSRLWSAKSRFWTKKNVFFGSAKTVFGVQKHFLRYGGFLPAFGPENSPPEIRAGELFLRSLPPH